MNEEGWAWPVAARKAHYFVNGRSLCDRWLFWGSNLGAAGEDSLDDCKVCTKRLTKRLGEVS